MPPTPNYEAIAPTNKEVSFRPQEPTPRASLSRISACLPRRGILYTLLAATLLVALALSITSRNRATNPIAVWTPFRKANEARVSTHSHLRYRSQSPPNILNTLFAREAKECVRECRGATKKEVCCSLPDITRYTRTVCYCECLKGTVVDNSKCECKCRKGSKDPCCATPSEMSPSPCACPKILAPVCCSTPDGNITKDNECICTCGAGGTVLYEGECAPEPTPCKCPAINDPVCCSTPEGKVIKINACECECVTDSKVIPSEECPYVEETCGCPETEAFVCCMTLHGPITAPNECLCQCLGYEALHEGGCPT